MNYLTQIDRLLALSIGLGSSSWEFTQNQSLTLAIRGTGLLRTEMTPQSDTYFGDRHWTGLIKAESPPGR